MQKNFSFSRLLVIFSLLANLPSAHRILLYAPGYGGSHVVFHARLADAIARGGHEVVTLEPEYAADPASFKGTALAKRIIISGLLEKSGNDEAKIMEKFADKVIFTREPEVMITSYGLLVGFMHRMPEMCEKLMQRTDVLDELRRQKFDAIVYEPSNLCGAGIGHLLGIRTQIIVTSMTMVEIASDLMGLPWLSSHVPASLIPDFGDQMTYWERVKNMIAVWLDKRACWEHETTKIFRRHFGFNPDFPDLINLARETSLCFVNSNELTDFPRPLQSNIVQIGGIGLEEEKPQRKGDNGTMAKLGEPWETEMARGADGVVLVSFGTHVPTSHMPPEFRRNLLAAIRAVPNCHFVMKVDRQDMHLMESLTSDISNLFITDWVPQSKLLAHPRLRLFVSHAGFNSLSESAFYGVPMVAVPFFTDQYRNTHLSVRNGWAIRVDKYTLFDSHQQLTEAIKEMLSNARFARAAHRTRRLIRALPLSAEQRLQGHLALLLDAGGGTLPEWRSAGRHLGPWAFYQLDILVPALLAAQLLLFLVTRALHAVFRRMIFGSNRVKIEGTLKCDQ